MSPDFESLSYASSMGPKLKLLVEQQLTSDLKHYGINDSNLKFDWSDCCIEGHCTEYLDGSVENFSSIGVYNSNNQLVGAGWMEFVREGDFFLAFWDDIKTYDHDGKVIQKKPFIKKGVPSHILEKIPNNLKHKYINIII